MSRYYTKLECGCLVSCDGAGGLIPCSYEDNNPNCKANAYMKEHDMKYGYCPICHPIEYRKAIEEFGE